MASDVPLIAGSNLVIARRVARQFVGDEAFDAAVASLTPEERAAYLDSSVLSWVPVALIDAAMEKIARAGRVTAEELVIHVTRVSQEEMLHTIYRILMRVTTDEALIGRTNTFYSKVYDTGRLTSEFPAPGRANVTLHEWPGITPLQLVGLGAGIEATLRCAGRKEARVHGKRTPDGAIYACTWRK